MATASVYSYSSKRMIKPLAKYWTVAVLGWQDSLVYRFNALVWVAYAVLPSLTFMLIWLARYDASATSDAGQSTLAPTVNGLTLQQMMTYYLLVTALSVAITPHPEWDIAQAIRDGKITQFIVRPIGYFGYRLAWETSYQIVKTAMFLPALAVMAWFFRAYLEVPSLEAARFAWFLLATTLAYLLLSQIKFLLGISAFWFAEVNGFLEIWNIFTSVFSGRLLPLSLLPVWLQSAGGFLPFALLYDFPIQILLGNVAPEALWLGLARQIAWLAALTVAVRLTWRRGLLAYEAYGG